MLRVRLRAACIAEDHATASASLVVCAGPHYLLITHEAPMLCIAAKEDGIIRIGDDIVIYITEVSGGQVRLSMSVPKSVPIQHIPPTAPTIPVITRRASGR